MQQRNRLVYDAVVKEQIPCVVFMGGGYSKPIGPTVDAFYDLFIDAAIASQQCGVSSETGSSGFDNQVQTPVKADGVNG